MVQAFGTVGNANYYPIFSKPLKKCCDLATSNGISVRKGHTNLTNMVAAGEVPVALTVYNYKIEQMKNSGAPIDWFALDPTIARPNANGVARNAPHPHAALKWVCLVPEGQSGSTTRAATAQNPYKFETIRLSGLSEPP